MFFLFHLYLLKWYRVCFVYKEFSINYCLNNRTSKKRERERECVCVCVCVCISHSIMFDSPWPHRLQPTRLPILRILQARILEWESRLSSCLFSCGHEDPDAGKDWGQEEKGATEDEMVGWYHQLNGHKFEQTLGGSEGQRSLACWSPWGHKESDTT